MFQPTVTSATNLNARHPTHLSTPPALVALATSGGRPNAVRKIEREA
jgi:hypothetical protein